MPSQEAGWGGVGWGGLEREEPVSCDGQMTPAHSAHHPPHPLHRIHQLEALHCSSLFPAADCCMGSCVVGLQCSSAPVWYGGVLCCLVDALLLTYCILTPYSLLTYYLPLTTYYLLLTTHLVLLEQEVNELPRHFQNTS